MKKNWMGFSAAMLPCAVLCLAAAFVASCRNVDADSGTRYYVSPNGLDANPGTRAEPFATLVRARDAVRGQRSGQPVQKPASIVLMDGTHVLPEPFVLAPEDSCISFEAAPGAKPVVSGGVRIGGWRKHGGKLWVADVPWLAQRPEPFTQLFVNGVRRTCARTPNEGAYFYTKRLSLTFDNPGQCLGFSYNKEDALPWLGQPGVRVALFHNWVNSYNRIQSVDPVRRRVTFTRPAGIFFLGSEVRYYVENSLDALDAPGEWYADRERGLLFYYPVDGERMPRAEVIAPTLEATLVSVVGAPEKGAFVEGVYFRGISFQHTDAGLSPDYRHSVQGANLQRGAFFAKGMRHSRIEDCEFTRLGEHGVSLREGCTINFISGNHFHDLGGGGVYLSEGSPVGTNDWCMTAFNVIDNNFIHDGGHIFRAGCGVFLGGSASHNRITHNEICDLNWMGIHLGWSWTGRAPAHTHHNEVAYNHIHHLGNGVLNDIGGIYTLGVSPGTVLHHNRIHDITRFERGAEGYGGWGIYPDAGSSQITIANNVVHDTRDGGLHLHNDGHPWGNTVTNNIFAFSRAAELIRNANRDHENRHVDVFRNITYGSSTQIVEGTWHKGGNFAADSNLYWSTSTPAPLFGKRTFAEWQSEGYDRHGRVADPGFVNPAARDFTLRPGSPALALGFAPIDISTAGLYGDRAWTRLPDTIRHRRVETAAAPPAPRELRHAFEDEVEGEPPDFARVSEENTQAVVRVVAAGVAGPSQCLRVTDGPGQTHSYNPHYYYTREFPAGPLRGSFDLRHETGAVISHEWRDWPAGESLKSGPSLRAEADGSLMAGGRKLAMLPPGQWVHIEMTCVTGAAADGTWSLAVTLPGQPAQRFDGFTCDPAFKRLNWLGFTSLATDTTVFYLDNVLVTPVE